MDKKASEILGESVIAGVTLEAKGTFKKTVGFAMGGAIGEALAGIDLKPASPPGDHSGIFYVAAGPNNIGFFSLKRGLFKTSLSELLVKHPRSDLKVMEIESGAMPAAHFVFQDGTHYVMVTPRIHLGKLKQLRKELIGE
jgi:hypothetical protein